VEYVLSTRPRTVLDAAERYMVNAGYSTQARTENSITFSGRIGMGGGMQALVLGISLFDPMFATQSITAHNTGNTDSTTLLVRPDFEETTRVTIPDDAKPSNNLLRFWIEADILKNPGTQPMLKYKASYNAIHIYNDRVEGYGRITPIWSHKGTIPMENITAVRTKGGRLIVEGQDGQIFKAGGHTHADAEAAKALIESRIRVHQTLDPFESLTSPLEGPPAPPGEDIPDQIKKLADLRDQGVITTDEFETKKADLLDRM
jgi:hypothetical protein